MTIKTKAQHQAITGRHQALLSGEERIPSPSPRLLREHGRYLPGEVAAKLITSYSRRTTRHCREDWAAARAGRRRRTRVA